MKRDTRLQHFADDRERFGGAAASPIFRASLFTFPDVASLEAAFARTSDRPLYSRVSNPTTRVLERKLADLESTEDAIALASGMAAVSSTLLGLLESGDHIVMLSSAYAPTLALAEQGLPRYGIRTELLGATEFSRLEEAMRPETRIVYIESPASLTFEMLDLDAIVETARRHGAITVIDNSWATPIFQRPIERGIDIVLHSGTKYLAGHSDMLMGAIATREELCSRIREAAILLGATLSPEDAFLAMRGLRTLSLRMRRHEESALRVATFLETSPDVACVHHPGLESSPAHALARRQLDGTSGLFSFELASGRDPRRLVDALDIFQIGVSWGGFESLAIPIISTMPPGSETALREDIPPGLVRLSIGLEDADDLVSDLERALEACR